MNKLISVEDLSKSILEDCEKTDKKHGLKEGTSFKFTALRIAAANGFPITKEEFLDTFMEGFVDSPEVQAILKKNV